MRRVPLITAVAVIACLAFQLGYKWGRIVGIQDAVAQGSEYKRNLRMAIAEMNQAGASGDFVTLRKQVQILNDGWDRIELIPNPNAPRTKTPDDVVIEIFNVKPRK